MCLCDCNCAGCWCAGFSCACLMSYHSTFGGQCYYNMPWANCICQRILASTSLCVSNPGSAGAGSGGGIIYCLAGQSRRCQSGGFGNDPNESGSFTEYGTPQIQVQPMGIGAQSGRSSANGLNAVSEPITTNIAGSFSAGGGSTYNCWGSGALVCCLNFSQDHFTFIFGTSSSQFPWAGLCSAGATAGTPATSIKCMNLGYIRNTDVDIPTDSGLLPLSALKSSTGTNVNDIKFGYGATGYTAAGYGGGGNRSNPAGGQGLVVVIY